MIASCVAFGVSGGLAVVAVLAYRAFTFWIPLLRGVVAYFQLRRTVTGWESERSGRVRHGVYTSQSKVKAARAG